MQKEVTEFILFLKIKIQENGTVCHSIVFIIICTICLFNFFTTNRSKNGEAMSNMCKRHFLGLGVIKARKKALFSSQYFQSANDMQISEIELLAEK